MNMHPTYRRRRRAVIGLAAATLVGCLGLAVALNDDNGSDTTSPVNVTATVESMPVNTTPDDTPNDDPIPPDDGGEWPVKLARGNETWTSPGKWTQSCESDDPDVFLWRVDDDPMSLPMCGTEAEMRELREWADSQDDG